MRDRRACGDIGKEMLLPWNTIDGIIFQKRTATKTGRMTMLTAIETNVGTKLISVAIFDFDF